MCEVTTEQQPRTDSQTRTWLADRLGADPQLWERLGFTGDDLADVRRWSTAVLTDETQAGVAARRRVLEHALALPGLVGDFSYHSGFFGSMEDEGHPIDGAGRGYGTLAILALAAGVDAVRAYHASRGVPDATSWETLADLGQQVRVHRETYGEFGLHTYSWLCTAWCGALYGLGRLQFNLYWYVPREGAAGGVEPRWVLSTHIPGTGPLDPAAVDDSFRRAVAFFAEHFPDFPTSEFYCSSWLLDPRMGLLDQRSNTARFQARWAMEDEGRPDDSAAIFFLWRRRGEVEPSDLPIDSSLRRLVVAEITAGRPWRAVSGLIAQGDAVLGEQRG